MWNEEERTNANEGNDIYVECKVIEPKAKEQAKKTRVAKKAAKYLAGVMCTALIAGASFTIGAASAGKFSGEKQQEGQRNTLPDGESNGGEQITDASAMSMLNLTSQSSKEGQYYSVREIAEKYVSSVVAITTKTKEEVTSWYGQRQEYESEGAGSGIIVGVTDTELIIATNNHVVENSTTLSVCFNDSEDQIYEGYVKGTDASNDLAVVGVKLSDIPTEVLKTLTVAVLGNSDECAMGDQVVAIGNALGYGQTLTAGYVSALNREVTVDGVTYTLIQTDAAINPGNSGGALFNMKGEVIGINSVKFVSSEVEGIGYAIPITKAIPILNELAEREPREVVPEEEQGYLGISGRSVTSSDNYYNMPLGLYVNQVTEGSAAEAAGMKNGDIITNFDGMEVSSIQQLKNYLQYYRKGEKVEVIVKRLSNGVYEAKILTVTLGEKPAEEESNESDDEGQRDAQNGRSDRYDWNDFWNNFGFGYPNW